MSTHSPFTTLRIEGAILPPDLLQRIADGDTSIGGLTPEAYHLAKGEKINEAINRAWNRALGAWASFRAAVDKLPEGDPGTTLTRERWLLPLFAELGYGRLATAKAIEIAGDAYPISHGWQNTPIHLVGFRVDLDKRTPGVAGAARNSPHGLVQMVLNRSETHLWGFVSNGLRLRILRDNKMLTRQAFVEFDLQAMMEGQVYADFALLWLVCHQSRVEADKPEECWLEKWSRVAAEQGTRALDQLRGGVENAIVALGRGFLAHPARANRALREKLATGKLDAREYYRQLLRLVYRLIFLFVAEDRGLLLDPNADTAARERYTRFYSTAKLRALAERRRGTRHSDLYHGLRLVMEKLATGCPELGLPALGGFLFSPQAIPDLAECEIANHDLLEAIRALAFTMDRNTRRVVDYKNLGAEELGSVYESLLELHPVINSTAGTFELKTTSGNERKTTGSFYTPTSLINVLLDSALDPVIEETVKGVGSRESGMSNSRLPTPESQERALLSLKICDPASGSGHFLVAAAHRLARRLAAIRTGDEEPSPDALRAALRDVIAHCLYGVDVNPDAVELCKVSLWMESLVPGKPLSFLDAHIKCGNSLIGVAPGLDIEEIPDEAFNPVTGDHKPTASALKKRNKRERESGQLPLTVTVLESLDDLQRWVAERARRLSAMPEDDAAQVEQKRQAYRQLTESEKYARKKLEYDVWTAAFFWRIESPNAEMNIVAPTQGELAKLRRGEKLNPNLVRDVQALAERLRFFHWELEFPEVFQADDRPPAADDGQHAAVSGQRSTVGGFDCILSNPPWERIKLQEEEFFAARDPQIATAPNKAARQKLIEALPQKNPALAREFEDAKHAAEATSKFVRASQRFPLTAVGDVNTYALFAEHARALLDANGRAGIILPTGIATDDTTKAFFGDLIAKRSLVSLFDFENREALFPGVHRSYKFCLLTLRGRASTDREDVEDKAQFSFFLTRVEHLRDERRRFTLTAEEIARINPNTRTMPVFRTQADAELTRKIYARVPVLVNEATGENPWNIYFTTMFHSSADAHVFMDSDVGDRGLRIYEGKMFMQYDHRAASVVLSDKALVRKRQSEETQVEEYRNPNFLVQPQYWALRESVPEKLRWNWVLCFKKVTSPTNERTILATILPECATNDSIHLILGNESKPAELSACLLGNLNSLTADFVCRQKLGGVNLNFYVLKQLPVLPPTAYTPADVEFIVPRVVELVYTAWDIKAFADDVWREASASERASDESPASTGASPMNRADTRADAQSALADLHRVETPNAFGGLRAAIQRQWEANRAATGGHAWAPPEWAKIAEDGIPLPPFKWDEERRAVLRAELDAYYARLYGLTRDELRYILDPKDVYGEDFPGETFRVLKEKEIKQYGEYRTRRLVLEKWDEMEGQKMIPT